MSAPDVYIDRCFVGHLVEFRGPSMRVRPVLDATGVLMRYDTSPCRSGDETVTVKYEGETVTHDVARAVYTCDLSGWRFMRRHTA